MMRRCSKHQGGCHSGDRISLLSDDIIIFILSFLNFKEAVVTSVLSRRWRHMWTFTKRLEFDFKDWRPADLDSRLRKPTNTNRFIEGIKKVLSSHKGSTLEQFRVSYGLSGKFKQEIDKWLKFASAKRVQRLELDFHSCNGTVSRGEDGIHELTYGVVDQNSGTSLKKLSSKFCTINGCEFACFESLKVLYLRGVNVSGEVLESFLSCCPSLEKLTVHESLQLTRLKVQGPSLVLKYLEIRRCPMLEVVEICNVNLVTLVCTGRKTSWNLHNTPALVNLTIAGRNLNNPGLTQFYCCLSQLETLTMQCWNASEGLELEVVNVPLELSNLKKLVLSIGMHADDSMIGCTSLIKASPKLQSFVLECSWDFPTIKRRAMRRVEKFQHQHIEEVEIRGYYGNKTHLELLMFFLENAVSLEKIIVDPNDLYAADGAWMSKKDLERVVDARHRAMRQLKRKVFQGIEVKILEVNRSAR